MNETIVIQTPRINLRVLTQDDAPFYLQLVNDPSFIENIRDKGIRTLEQAQQTIQTEMIDVFHHQHFCLFGLENRLSGELMGLCGLIKRAELKHIDLGYALLPAYTGQGIVSEAAQGVLQYAKHELGLHFLLAITNLNNRKSQLVLERLGFQFQSTFNFNDNDEVKLYEICL